jgi:ABC-2 type transport system ATP-binding protein
MIEAENLTKFYGPTAAIQDVTFQVERGEIVGFLGPNGAGKTTTMKILTAFFPPTSGTARVAGYDVLHDSLQVRRRVGYLPENVPLYMDQTVSGYLCFIAEIRDIPRAQRKARVAEAMEECGLLEVQDRLIGKLSKGFRQRVGLAQALLHRPEVLILDEPTIGLDPKQIAEIRQLIRNLAGDRTVILSTHILPEVSMICGRAMIINKGRIVAADTPKNLTARLQKGFRIHLEVEGPDQEAILGALEGVEGVRCVQRERTLSPKAAAYLVESEDRRDIRSQLARTIVERGWGLLELRAQDMSLEEIFLELVTEEPKEDSAQESSPFV